MKRVIVIAVHPDDETLGCGGTLLRHREHGDTIHWLLVTAATREAGFAEEVLAIQHEVVDKVSNAYPFTSVHWLRFPATRLDVIPQADIVSAIAAVFDEVRPQIVFLPFFNDPHSDHKHAFTAAYSCTKSFRSPSVERALMMETPSETDFSAALLGAGFCPNVFIDISPYMQRKKEILALYGRELAPHPFPRSLEGSEALATMRGAAAGCKHAEAFMLLKEIII